MELKEQITKCRKEKWFELSFIVEVLAIDKDVAEKALKEHIEKLEKEDGTFVYDKTFSDTHKVEKPMKNINEAYSQVATVKLFAKNLTVLMQITMLYGPSSIEVLGPDKREIGVGEVQNIANSLSMIIHQFAATGAGGIVITPEKKK